MNLLTRLFPSLFPALAPIEPPSLATRIVRVIAREGIASAEYLSATLKADLSDVCAAMRELLANETIRESSWQPGEGIPSMAVAYVLVG